MSVGDWYGNSEIVLTGVTSELGRVLLEKLLRALPDVRIRAVLRSRNGLSKDARIKSIFASPGYQRLRQREPNAISRVKGLEGNLSYESLGLSDEDNASLRSVQIWFHAAGPCDEVFEFCRRLPNLRAIVAASSLFRHNGTVPEKICDERVVDVPLAILRMPLLGPAHKEPMPGFVEILRGSTALMVGAGYAYGNSKLPAEVLPIDLAANTMIVAAWERGLRSPGDDVTVYNAPNLGCTWGELIEKGKLANRKFPYPTFGIRGMTSMGILHWMVIVLLGWIPSALCDTVLSIFGSKPRCVAEHENVNKALRSLEPFASRPWPVERSRVYKLQERLDPEDRDTYPICPEIDLESYILCAAASARKHCVNETNLKVVQNFRRFFITVVIIVVLYHIIQ